MMARRVLIGSGAVLVAAAITWLMFVGLRGARRPAASARAVAAPAPATPSPPGRKIKVRLFYVTEDGMRLTSVERDIAYGEGPIEQAREMTRLLQRIKRCQCGTIEECGRRLADSKSSRKNHRWPVAPRIRTPLCGVPSTSIWSPSSNGRNGVPEL